MSAHSFSRGHAERGRLYGMIAEYDTPGALLHAVKDVYAAGYRQLDTHTPFPVHGMDAAMGLKATPLPWITFVMGLTGTGSAVLMQWWMNAVDYPLIIGGKPFMSYQAYVPIMFELTVLLGGICTVLGLFGLCRLPQPYHPLFNHARFHRATDDKFFLSVECSDPKWDEDGLRALLHKTGATDVALVMDVAEAAPGDEVMDHG